MFDGKDTFLNNLFVRTVVDQVQIYTDPCSIYSFRFKSSQAGHLQLVNFNTQIFTFHF